ncbi:hypothetical protein [Streptomyces coelicoflavus]|uniref:hypothetical protein n=1 Tax=Streptomyces coelicoflavus TaxID=285562 RepID=UPI003D9E1B97
MLDDPAVVHRARRTYDLIRGAALSPEASLTVVRSAAWTEFVRTVGATRPTRGTAT